MTTKQEYTVSADHAAPQYRLDNVTVTVSQITGSTKWFADAAGLGCGKDFGTPETAIRGLLADHAYTNIQIKPTTKDRSYIGRSRTGTYHMALTATVLHCNYSGQQRKTFVRPATAIEIDAANVSSFCKRCFPNGKPITER